MCVSARVVVRACANSSGDRLVRMGPKTSDPWEDTEGMEMIYSFHWTAPYACYKSKHAHLYSHAHKYTPKKGFTYNTVKLKPKNTPLGLWCKKRYKYNFAVKYNFPLWYPRGLAEHCATYVKYNYLVACKFPEYFFFYCLSINIHPFILM